LPQEKIITVHRRKIKVDSGIADIIDRLNSKCGVVTQVSCSGLKKDHGRSEAPYICFEGTSQKLTEAIRKAGWKARKSDNVTCADLYKLKLYWTDKDFDRQVKSDKAVRTSWENLEGKICREGCTNGRRIKK